MDGIIFIERGKKRICFIENFSEDIRNEIRNQLAKIFNGSAEVQELPDVHTYGFTLNTFLDRYNQKSEETKKGMIGELLSHILIKSYIKHLESLSILKNKEERSIKKGFDIIYFDHIDKKLWYCEVKSGHRNNLRQTCSKCNCELLERAKDGVGALLIDDRSSLWESALIDAKLTMEEGEKRKSMRDLLSSSILQPDSKTRSNVVLISVLYNSLNEKITIDSLEEYYDNILKEELFQDIMIFSIQKETFEKIADFLKFEAETCIGGLK